MSTLVDDLLLLARLDQRRPLAHDQVDVAAVTAAAVDAARVAEPERPITYEADGPVGVTGDADRLRQVLDNLLTNALQHTADGTPVEVRVRTDEGWAWIEVADHGPGISPEEQAHIFEPFHRADPSRDRATGGVGLGLAIASAIAHAHGGAVGVVSNGARVHPSEATDSPRSEGATFWVRLPLVFDTEQDTGDSGRVAGGRCPAA
jgi:two-component system OmpR family sensor kinase